MPLMHIQSSYILIYVCAEKSCWSAGRSAMGSPAGCYLLTHGQTHMPCAGMGIQWPPKPLQCLTPTQRAKRAAITRGNYASHWWEQTKYKPLATNPSLGHVMRPIPHGDTAISKWQHHCNGFAPSNRKYKMSLKSYDIWPCLAIQTNIHI